MHKPAVNDLDGNNVSHVFFMFWKILNCNFIKE